MAITSKITFDNLHSNMVGSLTAAIGSLPLARAFSVASGTGTSAGLHGASSQCTRYSLMPN
ncbi:MAG: hypothetical protein ACK5RE_02595 [Pseudanabaena sp.]